MVSTLGRFFTAIAAALVLFGVQAARAQAPAPAFSQIVVFGDSLSDDGNIAQRVFDKFGFRFPSSNPPFDYSDYRFTNSNQTRPSGTQFDGVWHEQLAKDFLHIGKATFSLGGGTDYAFGGATTQDGTQTRTVVNNPTPFVGGQYSITIDNMGKQVDDYLSAHSNVASATALYAVWGGGNDLFDDFGPSNVTAAVGHIGNLVTRLANAGARYFIVPNVPPLGAVPNSFGDPERVSGLNQASSDFRNQLNTILATVKSNFASSGVTIQVYQLDVWYDVIRVLAEPAKYGFTNVTEPAQEKSVEPDQYLFWDDIHPTTAGHHQIAGVASQLLSGQIPPLAKAINVSTRGFVGTGEQVLIGGFIITGNVPKTVLVRGLGPSLTALGVSGALANPTLTLYDANNTALATNDSWRSSQEAAIQATGFAPQDDADAAILIDLPPGNYTAIVSGVNSTTGVALFDAYDLDSNGAILSNLSTRGFVGTGDRVLIGGFVIASGEQPLVVLRAVGPGLASLGVNQPLANPVLELHSQDGTLLATNDSWKADHPTAVKATLLTPPNDEDAVIVTSLPPGNYTTIVRGQNDTTGVALVEAYRLP